MLNSLAANTSGRETIRNCRRVLFEKERPLGESITERSLRGLFQDGIYLYSMLFTMPTKIGSPDSLTISTIYGLSKTIWL